MRKKGGSPRKRHFLGKLNSCSQKEKFSSEEQVSLGEIRFFLRNSTPFNSEGIGGEASASVPCLPPKSVHDLTNFLGLTKVGNGLFFSSSPASSFFWSVSYTSMASISSRPVRPRRSLPSSLQRRPFGRGLFCCLLGRLLYRSFALATGHMAAGTWSGYLKGLVSGPVPSDKSPPPSCRQSCLGLPCVEGLTWRF